MPRQSDRKILLKSLRDTITAKLLARYLSGEDMLEDIEENIPEVTALSIVLQERYLTPRTKVPRAPSRVDWLLNELDNDRFKQVLRMNRESFFEIFGLIQNHPIFKTEVKKPQTDVKIQMMVALERLGLSGNGASTGRMARAYGVSGKVYIFIKLNISITLVLTFF